jgi:Protein of unknown function (DUF2721)
MAIVGPGPATLTAMITPALFMTANASLIISTSNRMSRIVDRIRVLTDRADELDRGKTDLDFAELRRAHFEEELGSLTWRSDRVRITLTMLYLAFSSFVGTSLVLALDVVLHYRLTALPTLMAVAGVSLMLASTVNLAREARRALRSNRVELQFHRDLQKARRARRAAEMEAPPPLGG